ncbi:hypothetical protein D9V32_13450 [Mycetocola tolaasinivorans]|uniref:Tape measure protein N-terminal domain-containing protein n=1 Tax=Mycetocola tolaasinivorans TaxID=76635 RepID=A0A3L7A354_9MICO|nr:tape measure protein [Mycetocola tolaasinivorans]RLP74348.1 hypothetical protein D9V32_13450 [Mycetocola tolaasinivorans]
MAGIEIANAYVALTTKMPGVQKDIEQAVGGPEVQKSTEKVGKSLGAKLTGAMGGVVKTGATAIGAVAAGLAGTAIAKGLGRLGAIENATAKLKGLGNEGDSVKEIMKNALASVKGTAFGLGDAATTAAQLVAAQIKPGKQLEGVLKSVANSASAAGVGLDEMGSIYGKVASLGKAQNDVLSQVADRGLPIYQELANKFGTTTEQVFKMATASKIGFADFEEAMTAAAGTVAKEMGTTLEGSMDNFGSALGRIGAGVMGGAFPLIAPLLQAITAAMGPIEAKAAQLGESLGKLLTPKVEALAGKLNAFAESGGKTKTNFSGMSGVLGPLVGAFAALAAGGLAGLIAQIPVVGALAGPLAALASPIGVIVGAIGGLIAVSQPLRDALGEIGGLFRLAFEDAGAKLQPVISQLVEVLSQLAQMAGAVLAQALLELAPLILPLISMFAQFAADVLPLLIPVILQVAAVVWNLIQALLPAAGAILEALMPAIQELLPAVVRLIEGLLPLLDAVLVPLIGLITTLLPVILPLVDVFLELLPPIMSLLSPLLELIGVILPPLTVLLSVLANIISGGLQVAFAILIPLIEALVGTISNLLMPIIEMLQGYWQGLIDFLTGVFTGDWEKAWDGIVQIFTSIWDGIVGIAKGVLNNVIEIINGMIGGINNVSGLLSGITGGAISLEIPKIPKLAAGAIVPAQPGGILANIGEGRHDEVVLPLNDRFYDSLGGRQEAPRREGDQITVYAPEGMSATGFAKAFAAENEWRGRGE